MSQADFVREWRQRYSGADMKLRPAVAPYVRGDIEPYQSPIDGRPVMSRRQHREDLKRNGCRLFEGFETEQKEVARYRAHEDRKFEQGVAAAIEQTAAELKDGRVKPSRGLITGF